MRSQGLLQVPSDIPGNTVTLDLSSNNLPNATFAILSGLTLESVIVQSNEFTTFPNLQVIGSTLKSLDLGINSINTVAGNALDGLLVLEDLNLGSNAFTAFPDLTPVGATLLKLSIDRNDLQVITASDVAPLIVLTDLEIPFNFNLIIEDLSPLWLYSTRLPF